MPSAAQAYLQRANRRRQFAANMLKFDDYVTTPHDMGVTPFEMPANARIGVSFNNAVSANSLTVTANTRTFSTPALAANVVWRLDVIGRDVTIDVNCTITGQVKLYVFDEWMRPRYVATKTIP